MIERVWMSLGAERLAMLGDKVAPGQAVGVEYTDGVPGEYVYAVHGGVIVNESRGDVHMMEIDTDRCWHE